MFETAVQEDVLSDQSKIKATNEEREQRTENN